MSLPLGPQGFAEIVPVSRETLARLEAYAALLIRWSGRINLVGRNTLVDLWRRHILDSAQLWPLFPTNAEGVIDLGPQRLKGVDAPLRVLTLARLRPASH